MSVWLIKLDLGRDTDRHNVEEPYLAVIIVVHPDHLLYHPLALGSEVKDQLVWKMFMLWMADIIVINTTLEKGSTITLSWLKTETNTGTLHVNNPLTLMVSPLAPYKVLLVGCSSPNGANPVVSSWQNISDIAVTKKPEPTMKST